jgi:hypothetical protein
MNDGFPGAAARMMDRETAAEFLSEHGYKIAGATLAKLACLATLACWAGGPVFRSFGRKPLYLAADLLAWAEAKTTGPRRSTSEAGAAA